MYVRYAERHGLKVELMSQNENEAGGMKEVVLRITGERPYGQLKFEGGVHRVQRVPVTESQGRIHTSTATVAVLPEAAESDIEIKPEDLRIDIYRSGGHGGQGLIRLIRLCVLRICRPGSSSRCRTNVRSSKIASRP